MGQKWDTGETAFDPEFWREVLRVLKPGAHLVSFGGTRTYHRMACAIEDAFAGTGTTGIAAIAESKRAVVIEREAAFVADIHRRIEFVSGKGPLSDSLRYRNRQTADLGPLFGGS